MVKKHLKTFFYSILMLTLVFSMFFSFYMLHIIDKNSIVYSSENIDDKYGRLDSNTHLVLEKVIKEKGKENNVNIYFSFVYEDINENYIKNITKNDKAIFVYYNDTLKKLDVISTLKLKNDDYKKVLESKDQLAELIPTYLNNICENIDETTNKFYLKNNDINYIFVLILVFSLFVFFINIEKYLKYINEYIGDLSLKKSIKKAKEIVNNP